MPWICNFSRFDLYSGYSFKKDKLFKYKSDCVLIQISAFDTNTYPEGLSDWVREKNRHRFFFHDVKETDHGFDQTKPRQQDIDKIHSILAKALAENLNVIVQCDMGVSRSGAIALFGVEMGFKNVGNCRNVNVYLYEQLKLKL